MPAARNPADNETGAGGGESLGTAVIVGAPIAKWNKRCSIIWRKVRREVSMAYEVPLTLDFGDITLNDLGRVGGRHASLGSSFAPSSHRSDPASSGVIFTLDTESGFRAAAPTAESVAG
jgi:hypothetical protein